MIGAYEVKNIVEKLKTLPAELLVEVDDFIDFLKIKHNISSTENKVEEPKSLYGSAKGLITYISDDFNEPLDDFKEYM
jgi:hypothetical protein